jgi:DNA-binding beta-propeller fold protein YncE
MISRFVTAVLLAHCLEVISIGQITSQAAPPSVPSALKRVGDLILPNAIDGNFDHLAIDLKRQRLFITPEEAKSVLVLDLTSGKVADRVAVARPHAVLYRADLDRLYVTDGTDGSLRIFEGGSYAPVKRIHLEKDADSIGFDPSRKLLYIANGGGDAREKYSLLSVVDTTRNEKVTDIRIDGETLEAMALDAYRPRLYLNDKATNEVVVVDRYRNAVISRWPVNNCKGNVAIALDEQRQRLFVGCRSGQIAVLDSNTGRSLQSLSIHEGVDDLIYDSVGRRLYASTDGFLDVFDQIDLNHYVPRDSVETGVKARTARLVPELNRLYVAVPKQGSTPAHIVVFESESTQLPRVTPTDIKEAVNAPAAEKIVLEELSKHPKLRRMGLHVIPPGQQTMILIANGNETRLGIHTSESDFAAVKEGRIFGPRIADGEFYNMKMPLFDAQHRQIGILVMEIACTDATSEQDAAQKADRIRTEVAAQILDLSSLFAAVSP